MPRAGETVCKTELHSVRVASIPLLTLVNYSTNCSLFNIMNNDKSNDNGKDLKTSNGKIG